MNLSSCSRGWKQSVLDTCWLSDGRETDLQASFIPTSSIVQNLRLEGTTLLFFCIELEPLDLPLQFTVRFRRRSIGAWNRSVDGLGGNHRLVCKDKAKRSLRNSTFLHLFEFIRSNRIDTTTFDSKGVSSPTLRHRIRSFVGPSIWIRRITIDALFFGRLDSKSEGTRFTRRTERSH